MLTISIAQSFKNHQLMKGVALPISNRVFD